MKERNLEISLDNYGVSMSPDGHGGSLKALATSGFSRINEEIDKICYFQVDNFLVHLSRIPQSLGA